ncbi:MAG: adenylosuccinate synthase [Bdellovibrionia bacterium]
MTKNRVVVGAQWGDEGKGKIVDLLSAQADLIVRYQGGNNAGHTLVVQGKKTVLHLIPSGILHPGKTCLIANGVVFDPTVFFQEVELLQKAGVLGDAPHERLRVAERAHVILPYHRLLDQLREERAASGKIGTTGRGIGPAYEDKVARRGVQVMDLLRAEVLKTKLQKALEEKNTLFQSHFNTAPIEFHALYAQCVKLGEALRPYVSDVRLQLMEAIQNQRPILIEGAQGTLLDVDHGTYPYVTSSNTVAPGALTGSGLGMNCIDEVLGITKAYTTRVGAGPFPTELKDAEQATGEWIRKVGQEFGATTGRPRRTGWLDLVALKYAVEVNGLTGLAFMKADVLNGLDHLKVCTGYQLGSTTFFDLPSSVEDLEKVEPIYEVMPGWSTFDSQKIKTRDDLPIELQNYMDFIQKHLGVPIRILSTGPAREETLFLDA